MPIDDRDFETTSSAGVPNAGGAADFTGENTGSGGLGAQAKQQARDLKEKVTEQARSALGQVRETANSTLADGKSQVANQVGTVSRAFHATSEHLRNEDQPELARLTETVAESIDRVSSYLTERDPGDLADDLEQFARRQPAMFLAGAFAVGVLAARFLKSSAPGSGETGSRDGGMGGEFGRPVGSYGDPMRTEVRNGDVW